jgi:hypothetical protein
MKKSALLAVLSAALLPPLGHAQEPALTGSAPETSLLPSQDLFPSIPAPADRPQPVPAEPEASQPQAKSSPSPDADSMKKGTSAQLRQAVRIRQLKTALLADPVIEGELARARCAKTEEGRRVLMRNYYTLLYTRIEKLDPSVYEMAEKELQESLARYEQTKVRPSILIEPGIRPLPGSCSADHAPGKCKPSAPATPAPTPAPTPFVEVPPVAPS